jgi:hypothetical protein
MCAPLAPPLRAQLALGLVLALAAASVAAARQQALPAAPGASAAPTAQTAPRAPRTAAADGTDTEGESEDGTRFVDLQIAPSRQQTPVWCWVAVGEMVFGHLGVPAVNNNMQCGIVGALALATNHAACARDCRRCNFPAGDAKSVMGMLVDYPRRAAALTGQRAPRVFTTLAGPLPPAELQAELDAGRPLVVGINPDTRPVAFGASQHVALIVGYATRGERLLLIVNDPFPFSPSTWPDPYLRAGGRAGDAPGRYLIDFDAFARGLGWAETFLLRVDGQHGVTGRRCFAGAPGGQATACPAPPLAATGEACVCGASRGVVADAP